MIRSWIAYFNERESALTEDAKTLERHARARELRAQRVSTALFHLFLCAERSETTTTSIMCKVVRSVESYAEIGHVLSAVSYVCVKSGWPYLTVLVDKGETGLPSDEFAKTLIKQGIPADQIDIEKMREQCFETDMPDPLSVYTQLMLWRNGIL